MSFSNNSQIVCPPFLSFYTANLTASYTETRNELTTVPASLIMFILTGLFFTLNLFSGISVVSAILDPKVRLFLSSVLSLFLPVMSYLFSEAKNIGGLGSESSTGTGLSLRARLILTWMLLVELLRRKVDEIRMREYSSTIQRAGRVVWLGSLVFFNINIVGQKALFIILWILCVTRLLQRIVFTEVEKRSYAHGKNPGLINSYMAQMLQDRKHHHQRLGDHEVVSEVGGHEMLKRCKYIVMGEEKLVNKVTAYGYELNAITPSDSIITVGKVWELAESDHLFTAFDQNQRLRRLCLSFALFKLLRRRFEHLPAVMSAEDEARDSRNLILKGLLDSGESAAEALFQVMNDEVNFLCEYNHSVAPVVLASPFFLLVNYVLIHVTVFGFCLMAIILCGNGDVRFTLYSINVDNGLEAGYFQLVICFLSKAAVSPSAFFLLLDFFITIILFIIFFYEEIWEFFIFLLSNWFMVSLLCNYMTKPQWRESLTFTCAFRFLMLLRSKTRNTNLHLKQFSVLDLCWPPILALPATLSLKVKTAPVPNNLKQSIMEYMVEHDHGTNNYTPLTNGKSALRRNNLFGQLSWACSSNSVAEVALTWHIATCLLEIECPPTRAEEASPWKVAMRLSKYCGYLVLFHPELLPDNQENLELIPEDISEELKNILGCCDYYFSLRRSRAKKIMESIRGGDTTTETTIDWREIQVEATGQRDQNKVVTSGAKLGKLLMNEANSYLETVNEANSNNVGTVWKVLADVWTELIIYIAVSSDKERVKDVLVHGDEMVTLLWVLTMHTGISLPANDS